MGEQQPVPLVPTVSDYAREDCLILLGEKDQKHYGQAIAAEIPGARFDSIGSFGLKVLQVICGQADLYLYLNQRGQALGHRWSAGNGEGGRASVLRSNRRATLFHR